MVVRLATNTVHMVSPCVYKTNGHFWKWKFWMVLKGLSVGGLNNQPVMFQAYRYVVSENILLYPLQHGIKGSKGKHVCKCIWGDDIPIINRHHGMAPVSSDRMWWFHPWFSGDNCLVVRIELLNKILSVCVIDKVFWPWSFKYVCITCMKKNPSFCVNKLKCLMLLFVHDVTNFK